MDIAASGMELRVGLWIREFPFGSYAESQRETVRGSQSNVKCTARERVGSPFVSILCK
jgi:hypothetical protein